MAFQITQPGLDARLDALAERQPYRVSRASIATAILEQAVARFEATGDPSSWMLPAPASNGAQGTTAPASVDPAHQPDSPASAGPDKPPAATGDDARTG